MTHTCVSKNEVEEPIGGAVQLRKLVVREKFRVKGFDSRHPSGLQSLFGARRSRDSKLLNARTATTTVDSNERNLVFAKALISMMFKHIIDADSTDLSERVAGPSDYPSTALALFCL